MEEGHILEHTLFTTDDPTFFPSSLHYKNALPDLCPYLDQT